MPIARSLPDMSPPRAFGGTQENGWMFSRVRKILYEKLWEQYPAATSNAVLL